MKKLFFVIATVFALVSCGPTEESKTINATSTQFLSGKLAEYVEVVEEPFTLWSRLGENDKRTLELVLPLQLKKTTLAEMEVDPSKLSFENNDALLAVNLVDDSGNVVAKLCLLAEYSVGLAELIAGVVDATIYLPFVADFGEKEAESIFSKATKFTPDQTSNINPVVAGIKIDAEYYTSYWGSRYKIEITIKNGGEATIKKNITYDNGMKPDQYINSGVWSLAGGVTRGTKAYDYYEVVEFARYGNITYYIPTTYDYVFDGDDGYYDMHSNDRSTAYSVKAVSDYYTDNF